MSGIKVEELLELVGQKNASDLYLTVDRAPSVRVNGVVSAVSEQVLSPFDTEEVAKFLMPERIYREFLQSGEANFSLVNKIFGRFRVNAFRQRASVALVFRKIRSEIPTLEDLNVPLILKEIACKKHGLVLLVGATGSGKSTTVASMIDYRNTLHPGHIITVEDPIEFVYTHKKSIISQREVGVDTESYLSALKNALRQAPDVVVIGEIRDRDSMEAALKFSETGHLCIATLHSSNSYQALERIMGFFPAEQHKRIFMDLSLSIEAIVSQRLIRSLNGSYRVPAVEVMIASPFIKELIYRGDVGQVREGMEKGSVVGMQTFDEHLFRLYRQGQIALSEALRNADSENNVRLKIKLAEEADKLVSIEPIRVQDLHATHDEQIKIKLQLED